MKVRMSRIKSAGRDVEFDDPAITTLLANVDGLGSAGGAVYHDCRFSRKVQQELGFWSLDWDLRQIVMDRSICQGDAPGEWIDLDISDTAFDGLRTQSEKIDTMIATATPAQPTYQCTGDMCGARVSVRGSMCPQCEFDEL